MVSVTLYHYVMLLFIDAVLILHATLVPVSLVSSLATVACVLLLVNY